MARSLPDARAIADELTVRQVSLNLGGSVYDPNDPVGRLLFNVLAMVAEFESDLIRLRTREGMKVAKAEGHLRGKQPKLNHRQEAPLEADWNDALRALSRAQEDYERETAMASPLGEQDKERIAALASDFPALWSDPRTPQRERKRMVRLLIDDVTLSRDNTVTAEVRFKGGPSSTLEVAVALPAPEARRTPPSVIAEIDELLDHHTEAEAAAALNTSGTLSGTGQSFSAARVRHVRIAHRLRSREERLRERGWVGVNELAERLGVCTTTIKAWYHEGRLIGAPFNDKGQCLYEVPATAPFKMSGRPPGPGSSEKLLAQQP